MKVKQAMSESVHAIESTESIADAAAIMAKLDLGVLPVIDSGRIVGIVTDRDIVVRGVAHGLHSGSPVLQVMTRDVETCRETDDIEGVLETMADEQVRRVPVCAQDGSVVGIFSIGDAARFDQDERQVASTYRNICRPSALHSQLAESV